MIRPARPLKRLQAFLLDYLVILVYIAVLSVITLGLITVSNSLGRTVTWPTDPLRADLLAFVTLVLPVVLYFAWQESSPKMATWDKWKARIQVVNAEGGRLTRRRALIRSALKFLPWQIAHTALFHIEGWPLMPAEPTTLVTAGFALVWVLVAVFVGSMLLSKNHRTPYDWASGAFVTAA